MSSYANHLIVRIAVADLLPVSAKDSVGVFDVGDFLEDGFAVFKDPTLVLPLKEADPDDDAGEFVGVKLDFDTEELTNRAS